MKGKKVFISGASRGIGKALALKFASEGADLFLSARNTENLIAVQAEMPGTKREVISCDVSDREQVAVAVKKAQLFLGSVDIAVLNAGIGLPSNIAELKTEDFRKVFEVNLFGVIHHFEYLIPIMKSQGSGTIAGVGSLADVRAFAGSGAYNSSKIALNYFLEAARADLKQFGISVVTVRPGFVKTDMTDKNEFKMPFLMSAEKAAEIIYSGIRKNKKRVDFPFPTAMLTGMLKLMPDLLFDKINSKAAKNL